MSLFDDDADDTPFLGFNQQEQSTSQLSSLTNYIKDSISTNGKNRETLFTNESQEREKSKKKKTIVKKKRTNYKGPQVKKNYIGSTTFRPLSQMSKKTTSSATAKNKQATGLESSMGSIGGPARNVCVPASNNILGSFSGTSDSLTEFVSVKEEIEDPDITIEAEDFDYSCHYSEQDYDPLNNSLDSSFNSIRDGSTKSTMSSQNLISATQPTHSKNLTNSTLSSQSLIRNANQPTQTDNLTSLTTLLLDLSNKNNALDKRLTKLKMDYELKVAKIQDQKKKNEKKIQETLKKIQDWRDNPPSNSCDTTRPSLITPPTSTAGQSWHRSDVQIPFIQETHYMQEPMNIIHEPHNWYLQSHEFPISRSHYHYTNERFDFHQANRSGVALEEGDTVQMKHNSGGKKWKKATVIAPCSYLVRDYKGQVYRKSFKHLVRPQQKPYVFIPAKNSSLLTSSDHIEDNSPISGSGRKIKKRTLLNL